MKNYFLLSIIGILSPVLMYAQGWTPQATGLFEPRGLWDISIADESTVWAIAYDGNKGIYYPVPEFTKTTDGGVTWTPGSFPFPSVYAWANISAINADTAWIGLNGGGGIVAIYKTEDGGNNWFEQGGTQLFNSSAFLDIVHFWNRNEGVAVGDPNPDEFEIYTTKDGGDTWTPVPGNVIPDPITGEYGNERFSVIGDNIWFSTNYNRIFHSSDKGLTWNDSDTGIPLKISGQGYDYIDIAFWNAKEGIARQFDYTKGINLNISRTNDGGATWNPVNFTGPLFGSIYSGIAYVPGTTSTLVSTSVQRNTPKGSSYSNDGGTTWRLIDTSVGHYIARFLSPTTGWSAGYNTSDTTGGIFKFKGILVNVKNSQSGKEISFGAYPNPSKGHIMIQLSNGENADLRLSVIDLSGRVVYKKTYGEPGEFFMRGLDLSSLAKGEYILKIENGQFNHSEQIIIQ